ncbi:MAG: leucyl aminopeptidase [Rickettsiales bacterium]|nr:leucyl aminopeptidase [Rickettsiales bacterium]
MRKIPILIIFKENKIPKKIKESFEINFPSNFIFKEDESIYVCLHQMVNLNKLQKNFFLLQIGLKLRNFCRKGTFYIKYFGDKSLEEINVCLGWELGEYVFEKFKKKSRNKNNATLISKFTNQINKVKKTIFFVRDLINTPANFLGPKEIYNMGRTFLKNNFTSKKISGRELERKFPLIHAVGKGASKDKIPILCEIKSKTKKSKKKIFIIGKGVSFDTGGLNLKTGSGMALMKKDMGGAANAIGLANLIKSSKVDVQITLLLSLVENSVSRDSFRPSDIYKSRDGRFIEIGDTDAEGRLILADALTYACESKPDIIIDMATLTGASKVALGIEVPSFFCNDDQLSMELIKASQETGDPLWQLPLWENYLSHLKSNHADIKNIGNTAFGGAITAALFLNAFVKNKIPWIHIDLMAWSRPNKFSSYEGGEAMGIRALCRLVEKKFN